jgi:dipeptide/tripeptide permease
MTTEVAQSTRMFSIDPLFVGRTRFWAIFEQGDHTSSHLFATFEDAFNALSSALEDDPEISVSSIGY